MWNECILYHYYGDIGGRRRIGIGVGLESYFLYIYVNILLDKLISYSYISKLLSGRAAKGIVVKNIGGGSRRGNLESLGFR